MRRGTDEVLKRTYPKLLTFCEATFWQPLNQFTVTPDVTETSYGCLISVPLTQEQTLSLELGTVNWQIRGLCADGAVASPVYSEVVTDVHPDGVIEQPILLSMMAPPEPTAEQTEEEPEEEVEDETE